MKRMVVVNGIEWHLVQVGRYWHAQRWVDGRRVTRSTKRTSQRDAADEIATWGVGAKGVITEDLLDRYFERQARRRGEPLSRQTIYEHKLHLKYITEKWPDRIPTAGEVEDWLYSLDASNRYRRSIAGTLKIVASELERRGVAHQMRLVELPPKDSRKPDVFTAEQIAALFASSEVWRRRKEKKYTRDEPEWLGRMTMSLFASMVFGGLRPQEARAVHADQVVPDLHAILVTRQVTNRKDVVDYLKTGSERDPKYRGTILSDRGWEAFYQWAAEIPAGPLYTLNGLLTKDYLRDRLDYVVGKLGLAGRFTPYSGRYTYVTRYRPALEDQLLRTFTGHVDPAMPERYNKPHLMEQMRALQAARSLLSGVDSPGPPPDDADPR